jgi:hypothetical protein
MDNDLSTVAPADMSKRLRRARFPKLFIWRATVPHELVVGLIVSAMAGFLGGFALVIEALRCMSC